MSCEFCECISVFNEKYSVDLFCVFYFFLLSLLSDNDIGAVILSNLIGRCPQIQTKPVLGTNGHNAQAASKGYVDG